MDGTQTSEPTEAGPGSPGQASAFRRALDEQAAVNQGPLDLTVPLDIAEVRAALSTSGSIPVVRTDPTADANTAGAPPRAPGSRRATRHAGTKRLGKIAVFVALAAAMSVGTACALVLSSGGQGSSVSLPSTTGNIPMAPSEGSSQEGRISITSGASASGSASPSQSASPTASTASPSASTSASTSASPSDSTVGAAGQSASASASASTASPTNSASSSWVTLYRGIDNEQQEVSKVQSLLATIGYLDNWHRHSYYNPQVNEQPDQSGTYGSATQDAVAEFQQNHHVNYSGSQGNCDLATYNALVQAAGD